MCGIAGLFIKNKALESQMGVMLAQMTSTLCGRGPDSAGFAIYTTDDPGFTKLSVIAQGDADLDSLHEQMCREVAPEIQKSATGSNVVFRVPDAKAGQAIEWIDARPAELALIGQGKRLEMYKDVGYPDDVAERFGIAQMRGTHGIAHTRMATESAVTPEGAHPFSTANDQCLVHNGSISNHASMRRALRKDGIKVRTENDSEVAAGYLSQQMHQGKSLGDALDSSLDVLDGFFTFVVGTENGFGVLRDPIACKPAVMAETNDYVAFASEYKSLTGLPGIENARVWEPTPAHSYFWEH
ncbi:class II glutamine amidotransferase [Roseovarius nitratireducens]|uniref:class II glutamine amidotransferase n=1 Tax=Roseovarius nitratireducens TaxID=2044597 RepID=UPI000CE24C41|nr:glutamine amidotransferase family protein [Roseovarius nitratireducens]